MKASDIKEVQDLVQKLADNRNLRTRVRDPETGKFCYHGMGVSFVQNGMRHAVAEEHHECMMQALLMKLQEDAGDMILKLEKPGVDYDTTDELTRQHAASQPEKGLSPDGFPYADPKNANNFAANSRRDYAKERAGEAPGPGQDGGKVGYEDTNYSLRLPR